MSSPPEGVRALLCAEIDLLRQVVAGLGDAELIAATGCAGWRAADLVVHLRLGAEAVLVGLASPTGN
jgi:Mycothiol maleylpyruvate isomerase N-terminal domain